RLRFNDHHQPDAIMAPCPGVLRLCSSVRNAARSRRNGLGVAPTAGHGTRSSRSARRNRRAQRARIAMPLPAPPERHGCIRRLKSRGERLAVGRAPLYLLAETCLERILEEIARIKPALVIVDSVQTIFSLKFQSAPGSIGQVREAATQLLFAAKGQNVPTFIVGHVTKDGTLAGPKALEHVVDTVLYFEGERHHSHRVVRAVKNRFG